MTGSGKSSRRITDEQQENMKLTFRHSVRSLLYRVTDRLLPYVPEDQRKKESGRNPIRVQSVLLAILAGFSVLIVSERFSAYVQEQTELADIRADYQYYQQRLQEEEEEAAELTRIFEELSVQRTALLEGLYVRLSEEDLASSEEYAQLVVGSYIAGMTEVQGAGIRISMQDLEGIDYSAADRAAIIHDADVRGTVNLLKAQPSSSAMDINGERLVANSRLICTGPNILVNRNYMSMPFVISVAGDPAELRDAFMGSDLYRDFQARGLRVTVETVSDLTIPAFYDQELVDQGVSHMRVVQ